MAKTTNPKILISHLRKSTSSQNCGIETTTKIQQAIDVPSKITA
jgi:hypothetical protein